MQLAPLATPLVTVVLVAVWIAALLVLVRYARRNAAAAGEFERLRLTTRRYRGLQFAAQGGFGDPKSEPANNATD